jgi:general stress protein YciG
MAEEKREAERQGGEYMIQDRDHMSETGQLGGQARHGGGRQSEQSQGGSGQGGSGQQGGERSRKRGKLL